jgi:shikimate kinase
MTERIALVGARGTGKTTVGRMLADALGWRFVDADDAIEAVAGKSVAAIFQDEGEAAFRELEAAAVGAWVGVDRLVLATGGGAVLRADSRQALKQCGLVVWLTAPPAVLWGRLQADPATAARRPNLTATGGLEEVEQVLAAREPLYRETATLAVDTAGRSPAEVAAVILNAWTGRAADD